MILRILSLCGWVRILKRNLSSSFAYTHLGECSTGVEIESDIRWSGESASPLGNLEMLGILRRRRMLMCVARNQFAHFGHSWAISGLFCIRSEPKMIFFFKFDWLETTLSIFLLISLFVLMTFTNDSLLPSKKGRKWHTGSATHLPAKTPI